VSKFEEVYSDKMVLSNSANEKDPDSENFKNIKASVENSPKGPPHISYPSNHQLESLETEAILSPFLGQPKKGTSSSYSTAFRHQDMDDKVCILSTFKKPN